MSGYMDDAEKRATYEKWLAERAHSHRSFKPSSGRAKGTRINLRSTASQVVLALEQQINGRQLTKEGSMSAFVPKNTRRPCANGCGGRTLKHDICHACRDPKRPKRKHTDLMHGQGCRQCEGQSWRRPVRGKCKCGKRFAPDVIKQDAGLQRSSSIFDALSTRV